MMRRGIAAALTGAVLVSVVSYAAVAQTASISVRAARNAALLGDLRSGKAARLDTLSDATVRRAIAAEPLDGGLVNVAMTRDIRQHGSGRTALWLATVARMGWRDTASLQNRLYIAANGGDLHGILDISDALMRRQQMMDQVIPILSVVEADPSLRATLMQRLAGAPRWRSTYLGTTGPLQSRGQLLARYTLLRQLQNNHVRLDQQEVVPSILALDRSGLPEQGFALWQSIQPGVTRPLDDTGFAAASRNYDAGHEPVPYQWQVMTGEGFSAEAVRDGARANLSIDWSGRGVPVFAQQRTSAAPGSYALDLDVPPEERSELPALVFRLICAETTVAFEQAGSDPAHLLTRAPVPCAYPVLQIVGDVQSSAAAHQVTINRIILRPRSMPSTER